MLPSEPDSGFPREEEEEMLNLPVSPEEERQSLLPDKEDTGEGPSHVDGRAWPLSSSNRPQRSPKRMGVHHLHRKDSLTQAQEQGTLLS